LPSHPRPRRQRRLPQRPDFNFWFLFV
jgi:hypothetical protein